MVVVLIHCVCVAMLLNQHGMLEWSGCSFSGGGNHSGAGLLYIRSCIGMLNYFKCSQGQVPDVQL